MKQNKVEDWREELIRDTMQVIDTRAKIGKGTDDLEDVYKALENLISKIQTILEKDFDEKIKAIFDELDNFFATFVDERLNVIGDLRDYEQYKDIKKKWVAEPSLEKMEKRADELDKKAGKVVADNKRLIEEIEVKDK